MATFTNDLSSYGTPHYFEAGGMVLRRLGYVVDEKTSAIVGEKWQAHEKGIKDFSFAFSTTFRGRPSIVAIKRWAGVK